LASAFGAKKGPSKRQSCPVCNILFFGFHRLRRSDPGVPHAISDHVPAANRLDTFRQLAATLLLTYALRNADCHAKNVALRYSSQRDVHLAPTFDMLTTTVYSGYQNNPPGIAFMGKKTWAPGKNLQKFIAATFGVATREQVEMVEAIGQAISEVAPQVRAAMREHPSFAEIGARMLTTWQNAVADLRDKRMYALPPVELGNAFVGLEQPPRLRSGKAVLGRSELLGKK
jgi:serine/threonine-protein kinase HipA